MYGVLAFKQVLYYAFLSFMGVGKSPTELGTLPVKKLLVSYSLPPIAAMMASSVYNIIDSAFLGHSVGDKALTAMAITLPLMNVAAAFGAMVGAGGSTLISIKMGQKDDKGAANVLGNVATLNVILGLLIMTVGLVFMDPILSVFGASDDIRPYAREFMTVILLGNVFTHLYFGLNNALRSSGNPKMAMNMTFLTVVINLVLAPLFIFVFGWGLRGAALATVTGQIVSLSVIVRYFSNPQQFLHFQRWAFKLKGSIVKGILSIGISPFLLNICSCLVVILINHRLYEFGGDAAQGAYGNVNKVLMLFAMVVLGINQGMQPIAGYNFGARQFNRVTEVLKYAILYATAIMVGAFCVCELFPSTIMRLFSDGEEMVAVSSYGLRIAVATFPIVGFQMVASNFFQSINKAFLAAILSTTRQMLFLVPLLVVLPNFWQLDGVWFSLPIADALSFLLTAVVLFWQLGKFKAMAKNESLKNQ